MSDAICHMPGCFCKLSPELPPFLCHWHWYELTPRQRQEYRSVLEAPAGKARDDELCYLELKILRHLMRKYDHVPRR